MGKKEWTYEKAQIEALKYTTRTIFKDHSNSCWNFCGDHGIKDIVCSHMKKGGNLTHEYVFKEALKYNRRVDFQKNSKSSHAYAMRHKILDDVCKHMNVNFVYWTHDKVKCEALKYTTRNSFREGCGGAYNYAINHNILNDICNHMTNGSVVSDGNILYILKAIGEKWNGKQLYKIGVSSSKLISNRVNHIRYVSGFNLIPINIFHLIHRGAFKIEKEVLKHGEKPNLDKFNGSTEFRALSNQELLKVICMITQLKKGGLNG